MIISKDKEKAKFSIFMIKILNILNLIRDL